MIMMMIMIMLMIKIIIMMMIMIKILIMMRKMTTMKDHITEDTPPTQDVLNGDEEALHSGVVEGGQGS